MAASQAVRQSNWLRYLFSDLGYGDLTPGHLGKLCSDDFTKRDGLSEHVDPSEKHLQRGTADCGGQSGAAAEPRRPAPPGNPEANAAA